MAATTNSALASAPAAISPLISTTAVWGVLLSVTGAARLNNIQALTDSSTNQARRMTLRQRRAACCSRSEAKASFSSVSRSQPDGSGDADTGAEAAAADTVGATGSGAVVSEFNRVQVIGSMPVHHAIRFRELDADQATSAGAASALTGVGRVDRTMGGTEQPPPRIVKETIGPVVHLHGHMGAAIQVSMGTTLIAYGKGAAGLPGIDHIEGHSVPTLDQIVAVTQRNHRFHHLSPAAQALARPSVQALLSSHWCRSATECATWRGRKASKASGSWAP